MAESFLRLRDASKRYGKVRAVERLSLDIYYRDRVLVSVPRNQFVPPERRRLGMVFQSYAIWPHMTVFDNVAYPLRLRGVRGAALRDRVRATLATVGLAGLEARPAPLLSGGQQQRVALARALVYEPEILLLDEAFTLGWILVLDPGYGFANQLLRPVVGGETGPFNIYSFWGIVWIHVGSYTTAVKVMLLTPAFRSMDSGLEEASRVSGAGRLGTLLRITLPAMAPALLVVLVISLMRGMQAFEIELILGAPSKFYVYSTKIYDLVLQEPPQYGPAMALATIALGLLAPLIVLQHWVSHRRQYTGVGGQHQARRIRLGRWRYPALLCVLGVSGIMTVVPVTFLVLGSFMKLFGFFAIPEPWTALPPGMDHRRRPDHRPAAAGEPGQGSPRFAQGPVLESDASDRPGARPSARAAPWLSDGATPWTPPRSSRTSPMSRVRPKSRSS